MTSDSQTESQISGEAPLRLRLYGPSAGQPLQMSWEDAFEQLSRLPRMYIEPDGSFLWTGETAMQPHSSPHAWQLEGTIYDDGRAIQYVDILARCPLSTWEIFLDAIGETFDSVTLQLLDQPQVVRGSWLRQQAHGTDQ